MPGQLFFTLCLGDRNHKLTGESDRTHSRTDGLINAYEPLGFCASEWLKPCSIFTTAKMNQLNSLRKTMVKRFIWVALATIFFVFQFHTNSASAVELDANTRTIVLNDAGETVTLSSKEITEGQRLFNSTCTKCHLQGKTKTNNNVSLGVSDLAGAEPPRDNLLALVDYLKNPTSYDGENDLAEEHPNVSRPDLYPELRNLTEDDVYNVAGYMLVAPKLDERWGGTIYF